MLNDIANQAIKFVKTCSSTDIDSETQEKLRSFIIDSIKRANIPMPVEEIHCDEYFCPNCGSENNADEGVVHDQYCPCCGQKLYTKTEENYDYC